MLMAPIDTHKIHVDCAHFLGRRGYGGLSELAAASGLSTETVRKVRQNSDVELESFLKVEEGLHKVGFYDNPDLFALPIAAEEPESYASETDPALTVARKLFALAEMLSSSKYSPDVKAEEFVSFIATHHRFIDAYAAAIKKGS